MRRFLKTVSLILLVISTGILWIYLHDTYTLYYYYSRFPDPQKQYVETRIAKGRLPHCDGKIPSPEQGGRDALNQCFAKAILELEDIGRTGNPEVDSSYLVYQCSTDKIAIRFRFNQDRSDLTVWCDYRVGKSLSDIPEFKPGDFASVPPDLPLLVRWMVWLFG